MADDSLGEFVRRRVHWWLLITGLMTAVMVQYSFSVGPLSHDITYDDIGYFNDGLRRLDVLYAGGVPGFLRDYSKEPPHSPMSSLLAMASFAVFGVHDWAPYVGNGLLLLFAIAAVDVLLRDVSNLGRGLLLILVGTAPLTLKLVTEFRPDIACGLFTALGVLLVLRDGFTVCGWRRLGGIGLLFGLALLAKPSAFPFTLGINWLAGLLAFLQKIHHREHREHRERTEQIFGTLRGWLGRCVVCGGLAVVVALPHYLVAWRPVLRYIQMVLFSEHTGELSLAPGQELPWTFHWNGAGGTRMIGWHLYLFLTAFLVGLVVAVWRRDRSATTRLMALAVVTVVAFVVPTRTGMFNPFFAATFHWFIILAGLEGFRVTLLSVSEARVWRVRLVLSLSMLLAVAGVVFVLPLRPYNGSRGDAQVSASRTAIREVLADIRRVAPRQGPLRLYVPTQSGGGSLNADILGWHARKEGLVLSLSSTPLATDLEEYRREMIRADFILACAPTRPEGSPRLERYPSGRLSGQVLDLARHQESLIEIGSYPAPEHLAFHLFKRQPKAR
jgi:riboflavin transporter FmnP